MREPLARPVDRSATKPAAYQPEAGRPSTFEPAPRPVDRSATSPRSYQPDSEKVDREAEPPNGDDEHVNVQYADVGDLKKSLNRVRQAFRDAQKPN
jgi:hypothetical protein